jgi:aldose 1-epimerase
MNTTIELQANAARARLVPDAGGRVSSLRLCTAAGAPVELLHLYPEDACDPVRWAKGGIYPLLPFSNRIAQARVRVQGEDVRLAPHPDALPHALHGNAHLLRWTVTQQQADSAVLALDAPPSEAWPWHYTGQLEFLLAASALQVRVSIRNAGMRVMPAGIGLHPYFRHTEAARIAYGASAWWLPSPDFLATSARTPAPDETYRPARALPPGGLTHYAGGWDGQADVELPDGGYLRIAADPVFSHLVVHRPDNLAYLCLEPVSHVADGFNLAARGVAQTGTHWLAPGETLAGTMRFSLEPGDIR